MQMQALVLTADQWLSSLFGKASMELGINTQVIGDAQLASSEVGRSKYDTVVLDFDTVLHTSGLIGVVRSSRSNKTAMIFALATDREHKRTAARDGANFFLHRPIDIAQIRRGLAAARGFMLTERRSYFRCAVELAVVLARSKTENIQCTTMNISSSGMGITTPTALTPGETLTCTCMLPGGFNFRAIVRVIWDDRHGKSGLCFDSIESDMGKKLNSWLDSQFSNARISASITPNHQHD